MNRILVVGGEQKPNAMEMDEWRHYAAGVVVSVDPSTGEVDRELRWVSPPEVCPDEDPSIVFKTATVSDSTMYVPTQTEVLVYDLPSFEQRAYVSLPCFNDVHHVTPGPDDTLVVANTGLDMVLETDLTGSVRREWSVIGENIWSRFSRDTDYRKIPTTKPHKSHPNHVWFLDGDLWVTRCDQQDAICLTRSGAPIRVAEHWIHDGLVRGDYIYFTVVSGEVVIVDRASKEVVRRVDLNAISDTGIPLGWCRGIEVLDEDHVVVGFSRLRPTKWKQKLQWIKHRLGGEGYGLQPTRIVMFDLREERICWEVDVEPGGVGVIFSVHALPG